MHENMDFSEDIMDSKDSLRKTPDTRIGALKKIRKVSSFKSKLNIENEIVMSKILYLLPLYAGCPDYLLPTTNYQLFCDFLTRVRPTTILNL